MTAKEMTYQYRLSQWRELTQERAELGLSIRSYCAMKGIAENTYFYWQRRLREAVGTQMEAEETNLPVPGFTKVALAAPPMTQAQAGQLHVEINGICLSVDSGYPPEQLAALLRELSTSC